jgi:IS1 family transposase
MTGVHRDTIMPLLRRTGENCARLMDEHVRNLRVREIQADELWTFCGKKQRRLNEIERLNPALGDQWVFIALDPESKLVASFAVGKRDSGTAMPFMADLATRFVPNARVAVFTDALRDYVWAIQDAFGTNASHAQVIKVYASENARPGRYAPPRVAEVVSTVISGNPDPKRISTSHVERWNLSMRTQCRRFTRLTCAFSRNLENLKAAVALAVAPITS